MSPKEIEQKLQEERNKAKAILAKEKADFFNKPYDGELPEGYYQLFADAVFMLAPRMDNVASTQIKIWGEMEPKDYNFGMVGKMAEVIGLVPRFNIFQNLKEANERLFPIEMLIEEHRLKTEAFLAAQEDKKRKMDERIYNMQAGLSVGRIAPQKSKKEIRKEKEKRSEMQAVPLEVATAEA